MNISNRMRRRGDSERRLAPNIYKYADASREIIARAPIYKAPLLDRTRRLHAAVRTAFEIPPRRRYFQLQGGLKRAFFFVFREFFYFCRNRVALHKFNNRVFVRILDLEILKQVYL